MENESDAPTKTNNEKLNDDKMINKIRCKLFHILYILTRSKKRLQLKWGQLLDLQFNLRTHNKCSNIFSFGSTRIYSYRDLEKQRQSRAGQIRIQSYLIKIKLKMFENCITGLHGPSHIGRTFIFRLSSERRKLITISNLTRSRLFKKSEINNGPMDFVWDISFNGEPEYPVTSLSEITKENSCLK